MILDEIVAKRKEQLARELQRTDRETMRKLALQTEREVYSFPDALKSGRLSIIAEVKKASPSKSVICADFHPVEQAAAYERAGADAICAKSAMPVFTVRIELSNSRYAFWAAAIIFGRFGRQFPFQCFGKISSLTPIKLMKHGLWEQMPFC